MHGSKLTMPELCLKSSMTPTMLLDKSRTEKLKRKIFAHNSMPEEMGSYDIKK